MKRRKLNEQGQAALETLLFILLVVLGMIMGLGLLTEAYLYHMGQLADYYSMPFP